MVETEEGTPEEKDFFFCFDCTQLNARGMFIKCSLCSGYTYVDGFVHDRLNMIENMIKKGWIAMKDIIFTGVGTLVMVVGCPGCTPKQGTNH